MRLNVFKILLILTATAIMCRCNSVDRHIVTLDKGWKFCMADNPHASNPEFDDSEWESVGVPHDWAISGPFDINIDLQTVKVKEDGEKVPKVRSGRTGALPFIGVGWYRYDLSRITFDKNSRYRIEFDGVMSNAEIYVNGKLACKRPYGYISFYVDITDLLDYSGKNILSVRCENKEGASRWYPGAGIYRNVRLVQLSQTYVDSWGTCITSSNVKNGNAVIEVRTSIASYKPSDDCTLNTKIIDSDGKEVISGTTSFPSDSLIEICQNFEMENVQLWDTENPYMYSAISEIWRKGKLIDSYTTEFGIRTIEFNPDKGFFLNGRHTRIKGVCLHHDLGPLGAAVNVRAMERRLELLKGMGCNAIRTSHNPVAPEFLDLCDRMGFLVMEECFDEWQIGKVPNGYSVYFNEWAERDLTDMILRDRNHPSVIMWSIGNEIREQAQPDGVKVAEFLTEICHRIDPSRPVTAGLNNYQKALEHGFGEVLDVVGFNYKPYAYEKVHLENPSYCLLGSETASTVSSRGIYHFPVLENKFPFNEDRQCSSYDMECTAWGTLPDIEFAAQDDNDFVAGEFVWTGFDYLGEPTPYNETLSSRSSYFGIFDLAGMKKDRYYLYKSKWSNESVLHILPHWNWRMGDIIPVHCYTNYSNVELFLNGKSLGKKKKSGNDSKERYRLVWDNIEYVPGKLEAVAYDCNCTAVDTAVIYTAGKPYRLAMIPDRNIINADGKDISFVEIQVLDEKGVLCPGADNNLIFEVIGGDLVALCNGDPTSMESFVGKSMHAFNGKCMAIVGKSEQDAEICLSVKSEGLIGAETYIKAKRTK